MMSRVEIKNWAKEHVSGKRWAIWKAVLLCFIISWITTFILGFISGFTNNEIISMLVSILSMFITMPLSFGVCKFLKNFVVNDTTDTYDVTSLYKDTVKIVILSILISIITMLGFVCLIIPGIILVFSFAIVPYIYENNRDLGYIEILKLSYNMMKGHKLDLLVLELSFIGWMILSSFTLGILYIWLLPYYQTAITKFYVEVENDYKSKIQQ